MPPKKTEALLPFYRHVIRDAWRIAWEHKHLWIFGFFATFLGFGGISELFFKAYDRSAGLLPGYFGASPAQLIPGVTTVKAVIAYSAYPALAMAIFLAVSAVLFAVFAWIVVVSVGALISSVQKISRGGSPRFADGLRAGAERFWRLLAINGLAKIVLVAAAVLTGANLFIVLREGSVLSQAFFIGSFIVFTAIAVTAALVAVYASNFAMLKNAGFGRSLAEGWRLLNRHWLVSIEMIVILFLVNLGASALAIVAILVLSVPVIFLFMLAVAVGSKTLVLLLTTVAAVGLIAVAVLLGSFLTTFQVGAWTLLWGELTEKAPVAKLHRLARSFRTLLRR